MERGWVYGSLLFGARQVRTGHLLVGMVKTRELRNALLALSREFEKIGADALSGDLGKIAEGSPEDQPVTEETVGGGAAPGEASGAMPPAAMGKQEAKLRGAPVGSAEYWMFVASLSIATLPNSPAA